MTANSVQHVTDGNPSSAPGRQHQTDLIQSSITHPPFFLAVCNKVSWKVLIFVQRFSFGTLGGVEACDHQDDITVTRVFAVPVCKLVWTVSSARGGHVHCRRPISIANLAQLMKALSHAAEKPRAVLRSLQAVSVPLTSAGKKKI